MVIVAAPLYASVLRLCDLQLGNLENYFFLLGHFAQIILKLIFCIKKRKYFTT
jgi:hypothetical protein